MKISEDGTLTVPSQAINSSGFKKQGFDVKRSDAKNR